MSFSNFALFSIEPGRTAEKKFSDYINIREKSDSDPMHGHAKYIAQESKLTRVANAMYTDRWYLLMREGLYRAQIEKVISILHKQFLGYGTDIEIVKDNNAFYNASREIANFKPWQEVKSSHLKLTDDHLFYVADGIDKPIINLGKIDALIDFFRHGDVANSASYGIQIQSDRCLVFKISNKKAFCFTPNLSTTSSQNENDSSEHSQNEEERDKLGKILGRSSEILFQKDFTKSAWYQREKQEMEMLIARTDFALIERTLRQHITSNYRESCMWLFSHILEHTQNEQEKAECEAALRELDRMPNDLMGVDWIIDNVKLNHDNLRLEYSISSRKTL